MIGWDSNLRSHARLYPASALPCQIQLMKDAIQIGIPVRSAALRSFDRASDSIDEADFVHAESRRRLFERLKLVNIEPSVVLDLGAGTGKGSSELVSAYPDAQIIAADRSVAMLGRARARCGDRALLLAADAERLAIADGSVDLVFANLLLPWCAPDAVFAEVARVLRKDGVFCFASLGPDTLAEVRQAWSGIDDRIHVHGLVDMHDLGDLVLRAGLTDPVMDVDTMQVTYRDLPSLVGDLRSCGATNVAGGRRSTLTGRRRWEGFRKALEATRDGERFSITVELIFGQAFGGGPRPNRETGETIVSAEEMLEQLRGN